MGRNMGRGRSRADGVNRLRAASARFGRRHKLWGVWAGGGPGYPNLSGKAPGGQKCVPRSSTLANELVRCCFSLVMFVRSWRKFHAPFGLGKIG